MVPDTKDVEAANVLPPEDALYQINVAPEVPVTDTEASVGLAEVQKD